MNAGTDGSDLLQPLLDLVSERSNGPLDYNWMIVGEAAEALQRSPREVADAAYILASKGCITFKKSPDGNERGGVMEFVRPLVAPQEPRPMNIYGNVGVIQTGGHATASIATATAEHSYEQRSAPEGAHDPEFNPPRDRLPISDEMRRVMPSLHIIFGRVMADAEPFRIAWKLENLGAGAAKRVRLFVPGLGMDELGQPLSAGTSIIRKRPIPSKSRFLRPLEDVITVEFEDFAGRQYRQYARAQQYVIDQEKLPGLMGLRASEMSAPYHVKEAILRRHQPVQGVETLPPRLADWYGLDS